MDIFVRLLPHIPQLLMHLLVAWCDVPLAYLPCLIREEAVVPPPFEAGITGTKVSARAEITEIEVTIREDEAARFGEAQLRMVLLQILHC